MERLHSLNFISSFCRGNWVLHQTISDSDSGMAQDREGDSEVSRHISKPVHFCSQDEFSDDIDLSIVRGSIFFLL